MMPLYTQIFFLCCLCVAFQSNAQVVNSYASVSEIADNVLYLSNVNEDADTFEDGEWVVIMQMQDDVIGTTSNTSGFGDIGDIGSAGLFEIVEIQSHTEYNGLPETITLTESLSNSYSLCNNCSLQIISFPQFGTTDYTTTSDISALAWDGNIGGVVAIFVNGTLTLEHSISADEKGFRGGSRSNNHSGSSCVLANTVRYAENDNLLGFKGEGIYKSTSDDHNNGRSNIINGGGGGSHHNSGGAGGGNYTDGGIGGNGWNTCLTHPAGGLGGLSLSNYISSNRVFMGGGGGGGQQNNDVGNDGGNGGGIVLVRALDIVTTTCSGVTISANGGTPPDCGNDGASGGGAGGAVMFFTNNWDADALCPITITANGGDGSSSLSGDSHAGGGGGSQGSVIFNEFEPTTNVTTETLNGAAGCGNTSNPCNSLAGTPTGSNNSGILLFISNALSANDLDFQAHLIDKRTRLSWQAVTDSPNSTYELLRSADNKSWEYMGSFEGTTAVDYYQEWDDHPFSTTTYYLLKQKGAMGEILASEIKSVTRPTEHVSLTIFPNPTTGIVTVHSPVYSMQEIRVLNSLGQMVNDQLIVQEQGDNYILLLDYLTPGTYYVVTPQETGKIVLYK